MVAGAARTPASASRHLCSCLAPSIGTLPPAAWPDSAAFRPLHFTAANRCADAIVSFRRSKTGETGWNRPRPEDGRATSSGQQQITARGCACRRGPRISTARLRPVQATRIIREIGHFCTASISLRRTETTELTAKNNLDRHPGAGLRGLLSRLPCPHQPAIIPLRSSGGESVNFAIALSRRCQATSPDAPTNLWLATRR
jgi:hypothetical protein